jgi:hypothetical protein
VSSPTPPPPNQDIPQNRKNLYYGGMAVMGVGFALFLSNFCIMPLSIRDGFPADPGGQMFGMAARAIGGMVLIIAGRIIMTVGARGWAGSGMLLNPPQARKDVEPWARMGGGLLNDALEEVKPIQRLTTPQPPPVPVVKVRCRHCGALNDEQNKFCGQCGQAV